MLPSNIEDKITQILEKQGKGGWLRTEKCAKLFADNNESERTKFYRWRNARVRANKV